MARRKYGNEPVEHDGIKFDSKAERDVYVWLKNRFDNLEIAALWCKPKYTLQPAFVDSDGKKQRAITFTPDFRYHDMETGQEVVVEVKGGKATQTQAYKLREKLFRFRYPDIRFELVEM